MTCRWGERWRAALAHSLTDDWMTTRSARREGLEGVFMPI